MFAPRHDLPVGVVGELLADDLVGQLAPGFRELVLTRGPRREGQSSTGLEDPDHVEQGRTVVGEVEDHEVRHDGVELLGSERKVDRVGRRKPE